jgi:hypothetical protein
MRRCTYCFRFHPGSPTYCSHCGRTFNVRICARGHLNHRAVQFCSQCGSADLSTPAPRASLLHHLSGFVLYLFAALTVVVVGVIGVLALLNAINTEILLVPLTKLVLMLAFLYWATTLLPGPVRKLASKVGKAVGKHGKSSGSERKH